MKSDEGLIEWWQQVPHRVTLPGYIEGRARGTMKVVNGKVFGRTLLTYSEYVRRLSAIAAVEQKPPQWCRYSEYI